MRWIRGTANAILVATLIRPIARRLVARARQRARTHPAAPLMIPAEELLEAALLTELGASRTEEAEAASHVSTDDLEALDAIEEIAGRSTVRTLLLVVLAAGLATAAAWAIATVIRRRRARAAEQPKDQPELVAIPIETSAEQPQEVAVP